MKTCECGKEVASDARVCPNCGHRLTHPFLLFIGIVIICIFFIVFIAAIFGGSNSTSTATDSTSQPAPTNDANSLISRCGKPDVDDSTDYDNPRPPIPSRMLTYNKAHLMFAYVPGGGAKIGDPPPYQWKAFGVIDTRTKQAIDTLPLREILTKRMPCALR
jgi:hypothetical protein